MSPKILRRCSLCGKFHAEYRVEDPELGKLYLCYACWQAKYAPLWARMGSRNRSVSAPPKTYARIKPKSESTIPVWGWFV
jgi:hypothetical protein